MKSEIRNAPASVKGLLSRFVKASITVALSINVGCAAFAPATISASAQGTATPLKKISVDANRQIVFEYDNDGSKAPPPQFFEMPSPDHRLFIDLPGTSMSSATMPSADQLSEEVRAVLPGVRRVRFLTPLKATPTVRVAFDLAIKARIKPTVKIIDGAVLIGLNQEYAQPVTAETAEAEPATAVSDAYNQYANAMKAQNPEQPKDEAWGPRKGSAAELKGVVGGIKPLVSAASLKVPVIEPALANNLPAAKKAVVQSAPVPEQAPAATAATAATAAAAPEGGWDWAAANAKNGTDAAADTTPDPKIVATTTPVQEPKVAPVAPAETHEEPAATADIAPENNQEQAAEAADVAGGVAVTASPKENAKLQAKRFFNKAVKEHLAGNVKEAVDDYKAALAIDGELGDAHSNLGLAYNQLHNYADALAQFHKALAVNPTDAITYNGIGAALRAQKNIPGAIKNWETSVKLNPKLAVAHYNLGTAYESQNELDRAYMAYENATKNDQRLGEGYYRMGLIMMKKNKIEEAKEQFKRALKISENSEYSNDAREKLASIGKTK